MTEGSCFQCFLVLLKLQNWKFDQPEVTKDEGIDSIKSCLGIENFTSSNHDALVIHCLLTIGSNESCESLTSLYTLFNPNGSKQWSKSQPDPSLISILVPWLKHQFSYKNDLMKIGDLDQHFSQSLSSADAYCVGLVPRRNASRLSTFFPTIMQQEEQENEQSGSIELKEIGKHIVLEPNGQNLDSRNKNNH